MISIIQTSSANNFFLYRFGSTDLFLQHALNIMLSENQHIYNIEDYRELMILNAQNEGYL